MSDIPSVDGLHQGPVAPQPFNGPLENLRFAPQAAGVDVVFNTTPHAVEEWDPSADEPAPGFDIHLGVYAID
jgi:hypothetical protein